MFHFHLNYYRVLALIIFFFQFLINLINFKLEIQHVIFFIFFKLKLKINSHIINYIGFILSKKAHEFKIYEIETKHDIGKINEAFKKKFEVNKKPVGMVFSIKETFMKSFIKKINSKK